MVSAVNFLMEANAAFYRAFADGDLEAMTALWSTHTPIACVHPGWPALHGRELVMESWQIILRKPPPVSFTDAEPVLWGDVGMILCRESIDGSTLVASNLFVLEDDAWRMIHHHAAPLASPTRDSETKPASLH